jgi:hypothetical protein
MAAHRRSVYKLHVTLDAKYTGIINCAASAMQQIGDGKVFIQGRRQQNCVDVSSYWKSWPCLLPQHGPGRKHERHIELTE